LSLFFSQIPRPPLSTLFPYTTLFRSNLFRLRRRLFRSRPALYVFAPVESVTFLKHTDHARDFLPIRIGRVFPGVEPLEPRQHRRSEEHTSELQSPCNLVCRLLLEKKK